MKKLHRQHHESCDMSHSHRFLLNPPIFKLLVLTMPNVQQASTFHAFALIAKVLGEALDNTSKHRVLTNLFNLSHLFHKNRINNRSTICKTFVACFILKKQNKELNRNHKKTWVSQEIFEKG